jgi:hypothetical protein
MGSQQSGHIQPQDPQVRFSTKENANVGMSRRRKLACGDNGRNKKEQVSTSSHQRKGGTYHGKEKSDDSYR